MPRVLIERGVDPAVQVKDGWTSLHLASYWGQVGVARMLIERGADLGARIVGCAIRIKEDSTRAFVGGESKRARNESAVGEHHCGTREGEV
jgi:Ankyrin repeats (many copies)